MSTDPYALHAPLSNQSIIFLPGIDGTEITFEPFKQALPCGVAAWAVPLPAAECLGFAEQVEYIQRILRNQRDYILLAESYSGPLAVALVASGRIKPKCLVLAATFARSPRPVLLKLLRIVPARLFSLPLPLFLMRFMIAGGEKNARVFIELAQKVRAIVPAQTLAHRLKIADTIDVRDLLSKITIPCLYLQPASDKTVPAWCLSDFTAAVPDLRVKTIKGPHFIIQAEPGACVRAIGDFLLEAGIVKSSPAKE